MSHRGESRGGSQPQFRRRNYVTAPFWKNVLSCAKKNVLPRCNALGGGGDTGEMSPPRVFVQEEWIPCVSRCGSSELEEEESPVLSGALSEVIGTHVLGPRSFCYSIDPGRTDLRDASTEVTDRGLATLALVCSQWHGFVAATLEWERQRCLDESRLLLDPYVQPLVTGTHFPPCPRSVIYSASSPWLDPPRFAKLPFKEGDVLLVDVENLASACDDVSALQREARGLRRLLDKYDVVRCRLLRLNVVALPRSGCPARGPRGRVLVEVGSMAEPILEPSVGPDSDPLETPTVEDLPPIRRRRPPQEELDEALTTKRSHPTTAAFSLPLPLLEPGVIRRVVPACYRTPILDWPSLAGAPLRLGSAFCAVNKRPQLLLGYGREIRDSCLVAQSPDGGTTSDDTAVSHVLYVRGADGQSASTAAAVFGLVDWHQGRLDVFDRPLPPPLGPNEPPTAPSSLSHLLLDCCNPGVRNNHGGPRCLVCADDVATDVRLPCGCTPYCCWAHAQVHQDEHRRWCPNGARSSTTSSVTTTTTTTAL